MIKVLGGLVLPKVPTELQKRLTYPNPFDPDEEFIGYKENSDGTFSIPRMSIKTTLDFSELISSPIDISTQDSFDLRDYQVTPVKNIINLLSGDYGQCLLTAKTGSGKSFSLGYIIAGIKERTLILAHLSMLTSQMHKELSTNLNADVRIIDGKNKTLGDINICTFGFLHSNPDIVAEIRESIGLVVVDEAENMLSETRLNIFYNFKPKFQLLMTATPSRDLVGRTPMVKELIGDNIVVMEPNHQIEPLNVMFDYRHLVFQSPTNKMMYKNAITKFFLASEIPKDTVEIVSLLINFYGCIWIIIDSLKLQDRVAELLGKSGIVAETIRGSTSAKERNRILDDVASTKCRVILGSAPFSAGVSIPELGYAFRILPHSSGHELLTQQKGRLKRPAKFKEFQNTIWFDYAIEGSLSYSGKKRFKFYKEEGGFTFGKFEEIKNKLMNLLQK